MTTFPSLGSFLSGPSAAQAGDAGALFAGTPGGLFGAQGSEFGKLIDLVEGQLAATGTEASELTVSADQLAQLNLDAPALALPGVIDVGDNGELIIDEAAWADFVGGELDLENLPTVDIPGADTAGADIAGAGIPGIDAVGAETDTAVSAGATLPASETAGADRLAAVPSSGLETAPGAETPGAAMPGGETAGDEIPKADTGSTAAQSGPVSGLPVNPDLASPGASPSPVGTVSAGAAASSATADPAGSAAALTPAANAHQAQSSGEPATLPNAPTASADGNDAPKTATNAVGDGASLKDQTVNGDVRNAAGASDQDAKAGAPGSQQTATQQTATQQTATNGKEAAATPPAAPAAQPAATAAETLDISVKTDGGLRSGDAVSAQGGSALGSATAGQSAGGGMSGQSGGGLGQQTAAQAFAQTALGQQTANGQPIQTAFDPAGADAAGDPLLDVDQIVNGDVSADGELSTSAQTRMDVRPSSVDRLATAEVPSRTIAVAMVRGADKGRAHFEIRLDPPELGRVNVRMSVAAAGKVKAQLSFEKAETLELFQRDARALEKALADAGLDVESGNLEFSLSDGGEGRFDEDADDRPAGSFAGSGSAADGGAETGDALDAVDLSAYFGESSGRLNLLI